MITQNRLRFALLLSSAAGVTTFACGGIADPTRGNGAENVATVSGALTGTAVPSNARVALVYRKITTDGTGMHGSVEVGSDVAVTGGTFTMNLPVPPANYFGPLSTSTVTQTDTLVGSGGASQPPSSSEAKPAPAPAGSGGGRAFGNAAQPSPRDVAIGGSITEPMTAALAGFVVYVDTNGNGKLDLEGPYASSPDQILGGNRELTLAYLKGGGALDYEKLRDKSGILPAAGFNLAWSEGRWLPLNVVDLKLDAKASLPRSVCATNIAPTASSGSGGAPTADSPAVAVPTTVTDGGTGGGGSTGSIYPSPTDPSLHCSPDGRSYTYTPATSGCGPTPPAPVGLCASSDTPYIGCAGPSGYNSLSPGQPAPPGWPCPDFITSDADGGVSDASVADATVHKDGGAFDGGS